MRARAALALGLSMLTVASCGDFGVDVGPPIAPFTDSVTPPGTDSGALVATDSGGIACPNGTITDVMVAGFVATPPAVTIPVGSSIRWTNGDPVNHTATEGTPMNPAPLWDTGEILPGASATVDFCEPAAFEYWCRDHPTLMFGYTIVVE